MVADYLTSSTDATRLVHGRTVLELGAGAGLPSIVAAKLGARMVVVSDYADVELVENLRYNIERNFPNRLEGVKGNIFAEVSVRTANV